MKKTLVSLAAMLLAGVSASAFTAITDLRVQNSVEPMAVEDAHPLFSWKMHSDEPGQRQTAYRIVVRRESGGTALWDTGRVEDSRSVGIPYAGVMLQPEKAYSLELTVWDKDGLAHEASTRWETGIMSPKQSAWKGAEFVGSTARSLDAMSQIVYGISTDFKGRVASLILGADDMRMNDSFLNGYGMEGENYVRFTLDTGKPEIRIYRVGYAPGDRADRPFVTVNEETYPGNNLSSLLKEDVNTLEIYGSAGSILVNINGKALMASTPQEENPLFWERRATGPRPARFPISPYGTGGNYPVFPVIASVGFASEPGTTTEYTNYRILAKGQSEDPVLFDNTLGKGYSLFEGLPGVSVQGDRIIVSNPGGDVLMGWADPTYGGTTMVRTEFETSGSPVRRARLYATAMGAYQMFINGSRVGDAWFAPGDSQYRETMGYHAYDVTDLLRSGRNAMGAELFGAWYSGYMTFAATNYNFFGDHTALLARLVISYEDGTTQEVVTRPDSWKTFNDGPVRAGDFFMGERYDACRESAVSGWSEAFYDDSLWQLAEIIPKRSWVDFDFMARYDEPVKVRETLGAVRVMPVHKAGTYIYDMGVNMVGVPSITIPAGWLRKGDKVILSYGEQVYPGLRGDDRDYVRRFGSKGLGVAGHILYETNRAALDIDTYVAAGSGEVTFTPRSTFRGYQYIQIIIPGSRAPLPLSNVKGLVLSSCGIPDGTYEAVTQDARTGELAGRLFRNIQRSQLGNFFTIPTDCPQRNERMGWTGDAQAYSRTAIYNADVQNFWRQWMVALRDDQGVGSDTEAAGGIGSTVPTYNKADDSTFADGTTWGAAVCMVPWQMYSMYGDTQIVRENMDAMMAWLNGMDYYDFSAEYPHLSSKASGLSDHLAMDGRIPADLPNNAIYIYMMDVTARMARAIGRDDYASILEERCAAAKEEWNKAYFDSESGRTKTVDGLTVNTQTSYATPLNFGVFSEENAPRAAARLAEIVAEPSRSGPAEGEKIYYNENLAFGVLGSGNTSYDFEPYTITSGFSGTPNLLPALSKAGYWEQAARLFTSTGYVSWLYPVTRGATSMWERWNSYDTAFSEHNQNSMNSFNHFALGSVGSWMYEYQLGIAEGTQAGYKDFVLQPEASYGYLSLSGSYNSNYGRIESAWKADGKGNMTEYSCTVPANTAATLYLPVENAAAAGEGCEFVSSEVHNGVRCAVYRLQSGKHSFKKQQ